MRIHFTILAAVAIAAVAGAAIASTGAVAHDPGSGPGHCRAAGSTLPCFGR